MIDFDKLNIRCTDEEMLSAVGYVAGMYAIACDTAKRGLLCLEDYLPEIGDTYIKEGLTMIFEARDPEAVQKYLRDKIDATTKPSDRLEMYIIATGVHFIQNGYGLIWLLCEQSKWFQEDFHEKLWAEMSELTNGEVTSKTQFEFIDDPREMQRANEMEWLTGE